MLFVFGVGILLGFGLVVCIVVTRVFAVIASVGVVLVARRRGLGVPGLAWSCLEAIGGIWRSFCLTGIGVRIVAMIVLIVVLFEVIIREDFVGLLHFGELVFAVGVDVGVECFDELEV